MTNLPGVRIFAPRALHTAVARSGIGRVGLWYSAAGLWSDDVGDDARRHHPGGPRARGSRQVPPGRVRRERRAGARAHLRVPRRAPDDAALSVLPRAASTRCTRSCARSSASPRHLQHVIGAVRANRVVYASNHKSHTDYLVEPLVLDDNGIRPPVIAAGINLFGGPLGLLHRHVTGAIPIRRNTKDPAYLITLKAYVAEVLNKHDLFFYPEGGRSYSGELKSAKTGLIHAALQADDRDLVVVPTAIAYDLVLEDHILARQRVKKRQRPFARELAEMVRYAVGYRSRAFVTFGAPIVLGDHDPQSRRDVLELTHRSAPASARSTRCCRPRSFAAAMRPSITRRELEARDRSAASRSSPRGHANLGVATRRQAIDEAAAAARDARASSSLERGRFRVRERSVLRYYARRSNTCCTPPRPDPLMLDSRRRPSSTSRAQPVAQEPRLALRHAHARPASPGGSSPVKTIEEAIDAVPRHRGARPERHARPPGRKRHQPRRSRHRHPRVRHDRSTRMVAVRRRSQHLAQADAARARLDRGDDASTTCGGILEAAGAGRLLRPHRHGELAVHRRRRWTSSRRSGSRNTAIAGVVAVGDATAARSRS